jgi:S1-C subfamily serine protease
VKILKYAVRLAALAAALVFLTPTVWEGSPMSEWDISLDPVPSYYTVEETSSDLTMQQISRMDRAQQVSRKSTVTVHVSHPLYGSIRGTGTYAKFGRDLVIVTAAHVLGPPLPPEMAANEPVALQVRTASGTYFPVRLAYADRENDIAVLRLDNRLPDMAPVNLKVSGPFSVDIGDPVVYTGSPSHHDRLTIYGRVAGNAQNGDMILHSYAWSGASGSGIFDQRGRLIGVLYAVDVGVGFGGIPAIVEDIVYITPIWKIDREMLENSLGVLGR